MDHNRRVVALPLDDVLPNRFQPRKKFNEESIIELSESIKEHGVIQPIVVRPVGDKYEIIAGERRYKASCMAGLSTIPALITDLNDKDSAEVALIENVQRKDLTPIEEAISYKKILDMGYLTQEKLADKLGKSQSAVANKLRLLNLDEEVQEALLEDKISERHARSLLKLNDVDSQRKILAKIINERLTVRKTDEEINKMLNGNYVDSNEDLVVKPEVQDSTSADFVVPNIEMSQQENTAIEENIPADEMPINFEIPKFEDLFKINENELVNEEVIMPEEETKSIENNSFGIPTFEEIFKENEIDIPVSENNNEAVKSDYVEVPVEEINKEVVIPEVTEESNKTEFVDELLDSPIPFSFDNLFLDEVNPVDEIKPVEDEVQISDDSSDVIDIPQNIEETKAEEIDEAKPFDFSSIFTTEEEIVLPKEETGSDSLHSPEPKAK